MVGKKLLKSFYPPVKQTHISRDYGIHDDDRVRSANDANGCDKQLPISCRDSERKSCSAHGSANRSGLKMGSAIDTDGE